MKKFYLSSLQFLIIGFFCHAAHAGELSIASLKQDPRLGKTVSVVAKRIYIGELVEQFASQTGVPVAAGDEDGAADVAVTVSLHHVPLNQAMNALWSLVSYQGLEWEWERSGQSGDYRYNLTQTAAARAFPLLVQKQIQSEFESEAGKLQAALSMTPDQLKDAAKDDPMLQSFAKGDDPRIRPGMTIFSELTPEAQSNILHDHQTLVIPVSNLSVTGRDFVHQQWLWTRDHGGQTKNKAGNWIPVPEPSSLAISGVRHSGGLVPWLTIDMGYGSGGYVGGGWMDQKWGDKIDALWRLAGDTDDNPASAKTVSLSVGGKLSDPHYQIASLLLQTNNATSVPLIARLPDEALLGRNRSGLSASGQSLRSYLLRLKDAGIANKWRGDILLLCDPSWLTGDAETADVPWIVVKRLRESEAKNQFLTFEDLEYAAGKLDKLQLYSLSSSVPVMGHVANWHDLFAGIDGSPSLKPSYISPSGCDWTGAVNAAAAFFGPDAQQFVQDGSATHVRIMQQKHSDRQPPQQEITVQLLSSQGVIKAQQGFVYQAHQWQPSIITEKQPADKMIVNE